MNKESFEKEQEIKKKYQQQYQEDMNSYKKDKQQILDDKIENIDNLKNEIKELKQEHNELIDDYRLRIRNKDDRLESLYEKNKLDMEKLHEKNKLDMEKLHKKVEENKLYIEKIHKDYKEREDTIRESYNSRQNKLLEEMHNKLYNKNNHQKGLEGEEFASLLTSQKNPLYRDIQLIDTHSISGSGDSIVSIPSQDFICLMEFKNHQKGVDNHNMNRFKDHCEEFLKKYPNGHCLMINVGSDNIYNHGKFDIIEGNNFYGYWASKNMTEDIFLNYFYSFIDRINSYKNNQIEKGYNHINQQCIDNNISDFKKIIGNIDSQIKYFNNQIQELEKLRTICINNTDSNTKILGEQGYNITTNTICNTFPEQILDYKKYLREQHNINPNDYKDYKEFDSKIKSTKDQDIINKNSLKTRFGIPKNYKLEDIFKELCK